MKRFFWHSLVIVSIFMLVYAPALAAPSMDSQIAPGSVMRFEHVTIEDGLSQNAGLAFFQDHYGYLWIGTQDGLNRYDGYNFRAFKHDPEDPTSISFNSIIAIEEDSEGYLWIGTWGGGLNRYDPLTETFTYYQHDPEDEQSLSNDVVTSIKEDTSGRLWVGTPSGLDLLNRQTGSFDHFRHDPDNPESISSDAISVIFEDSQQQLWIGTGVQGIEGAGLNRLDPATGKAQHYQHDEANPRSLSSNNISSIYEAADGTFWIATGGFNLSGNGLNQFNPQTGKALSFQNDPDDPDSIGANDLMALWGDENGILWIGTWTNGLSRMVLSNPGRFENFAHNPFFSDSLSGDEIWSMFKDRAGVLWIGTSHSGLNKLSASAGQFNLYRNDPNNPASLSVNAVGAFAEDDHGDIWVATWGGGLDLFDPDTGTFQHHRHDPQDPESLSDDLFMALHVDSSGNVWATTMGKGLNKLNPFTGKVTHFMHDPDDPAGIPDNSSAAVISDGNDGLWIATFGGLSHFDLRTNTFTNYSNDPGVPSSLSSNLTISLHMDKNNNLWIGTWGGGLNRLDLNDPLHTDPKTAAFTRYFHNADDPSSISSDSPWAIHETADGVLWFGTEFGLNRFDPETETFKTYTEKQGLPNNIVLGILSDDNGHLWLTTNNGLAEFDPAAETFTVYDTSDGLQSNEFNSNGYFRSQNGTMYIGGINGFNLFHPEDIKPNPVAPQVVVTQFEVFNEPMQIDVTGETPIQLSYRQNFISFEFAAFDFQAPGKNQYAYKLEGFDEDWIQAGNRHFANYTNLPGGDYVFRVKASNSDGTWNEEGTAIPVVITPPFWQTWWFEGLAVLVLCALVVGGFRWRVSAIRERNILLEKQVTERTSELQQANGLLEKEIEQRKRAEEALSRRAANELAQSEARFQAVFDNVAVGVATLGLNRHPIAFNQAAERIIGYSTDELRDVDPRQLAVPEDRSMDDDLFKELVEGRRDFYVMERRYRRKDGNVFWARINYSLVRDLDGKPDYLIGLIEDIDEQKRASERLAEQEAGYRRTLELRVEERTHELAEANQQLQSEMEQRKKIEKELAEKAAEEAVAADRTRLARDLHDAVTQTLFSASLTAEVLPDLWEMDIEEAKRSTEELRQLTRGALAEMRTLLLELRPATLTQTRLGDLIKQLCEAFIGRSRLPITLTVEGDCMLPPEVQIAFYRIAQESLNNVFKYARATEVKVYLFISASSVHFETCDNGIGFDVTTVKPTSLGTRIMRERAQAIGADLRISSTPGSGTCLELTWEANPDLKLRVL